MVQGLVRPPFFFQIGLMLRTVLKKVITSAFYVRMKGRAFLDNLILLASQEGLCFMFMWFAEFVKVVLKIVQQMSRFFQSDFHQLYVLTSVGLFYLAVWYLAYSCTLVSISNIKFTSRLLLTNCVFHITVEQDDRTFRLLSHRTLHNVTISQSFDSVFSAWTRVGCMQMKGEGRPCRGSGG